MKIYFKEPSPATSGYDPIMINCELMDRLKKKATISIDYFDNIVSKPKYIKNSFYKILEFFKMKKGGKWEEDALKEIKKMGYVYFYQNGIFSQVKIGYSKNPHGRRGGLQTGNPNPLNLIGVMSATGRSVENFLQKKFKKYHTGGEWYKYIGELKEFIEDGQNVLLIGRRD